eukprot:TRINITY_DN6_c0_g1_i1.p1 TRINITY_DN6_c0_g1~~TRINITY_DN6_c0_g1_i1.p1  ORF type:complete len:133 (+),score=20.84 TRINITY_DN6_c0_g1_i1:260-658(+)
MSCEKRERVRRGEQDKDTEAFAQSQKRKVSRRMIRRMIVTQLIRMISNFSHIMCMSYAQSICTSHRRIAFYLLSHIVFLGKKANMTRSARKEGGRKYTQKKLKRRTRHIGQSDARYQIEEITYTSGSKQRFP